MSTAAIVVCAGCCIVCLLVAVPGLLRMWKRLRAGGDTIVEGMAVIIDQEQQQQQQQAQQKTQTDFDNAAATGGGGRDNTVPMVAYPWHTNPPPSSIVAHTTVLRPGVHGRRAWYPRVTDNV